MIDDAASLDRQSAYLEQVRALGRPQRTAGFIACLVGVLVMVLARFRLDNSPGCCGPASPLSRWAGYCLSTPSFAA
jgi:hypothetical protein